MDECLQVHRTQVPLAEPVVHTFDKTFSSFDFVEQQFGGEVSIHRSFSLARSRRECRSLVVERIGICGLLEEECQELVQRGYYSSPDVYRLSFWMEELGSCEDIEKASTKNLLGYLIVKRDGKTETTARWHVFESVFQKYNHHHNCVSDPALYSVGVVLDATTVFDMKRKVPAMSAFLFARLPGSYFLQNIVDGEEIRFFRWESDIRSHVKVYCEAAERT